MRRIALKNRGFEVSGKQEIPGVEGHESMFNRKASLPTKDGYYLPVEVDKAMPKNFAFLGRPATLQEFKQNLYLEALDAVRIPDEDMTDHYRFIEGYEYARKKQEKSENAFRKTHNLPLL